jgi:hypothetical protein
VLRDETPNSVIGRLILPRWRHDRTAVLTARSRRTLSIVDRGVLLIGDRFEATARPSPDVWNAGRSTRDKRGAPHATAADAIVRHGVVDPDAAFLQKPFMAAALVQNVEEVLPS